MVISKATAEQNRNARMQQLDLSGFDNRYPTIEPHGNYARTENANSPSATFWEMTVHKKSGMPVVYLHDPIGVAKANRGIIQSLKSEFSKVIHQVTNGEHYKSAVLAYHTFFNEQLTAKNKAYSHEDGVDMNAYADESSGADDLRNAAGNIDLAYLKTELKVDARKKFRETLRQLKNRHVEFMDGKFEQNAILDLNPDFISVNEALKDYTELDTPAYSLLWTVTLDLINIMPFDPSILDKALDLDADHDQVKRHHDLGHIYLKRLLEPAHPLHAMLFPSNAQVDEYSDNYTVDIDADEQFNGSGQFRPIGYAKTFKELQFRNRDHPKSKQKLSFLSNTIGDLTLLMAGQVYAPKSFFYQKANTATINPVVRLSIALADPDLESLHLVKAKSALSDVFILDGRFTILEKLRLANSNTTEFAKASKHPGQTSGKVNVFDPNTNKAIASTKLDQIKNNKGRSQDLSDQNWRSLFVNETNTAATTSAATQIDPVSGNATAEFLVVGNTSKVANKILEAVKKASASSAGKMGLSDIANYSNKHLPSLLLVFEVVNLYSAYGMINKAETPEERRKNFAKLALTALALPFSIVEASIKLTDEVKVANSWAKRMGSFGATAAEKLFLKQSALFKIGSFNTLSKVAIGFAGAGAVMSGWDMVDALLAADDDAAVAYGVQMAAGIGLALSSVGQGLLAAGIEVGFLAIIGPYGWAFLAVLVVAGILATMLTDSELEKWALHGPFGTADSRLSNIYQNKPAQFVHQSLLALLMLPQIKIIDKRDQKLIFVEVKAPGYEPGKSTLTIDALRSKGKQSDGTAVLFEDTQYTLNLIGWMPIMDKKIPSLTLGMRYIYQRPEHLVITGEYSCVFARVQHITKDSVTIPMNATNKEIKQADPSFIDNKVNGWAYAKPLNIG